MLVTIHQPHYMPWLGFFGKVACADFFILLDTVQYEKNSWQNRNKIRNKTGWQWLTVPVKYKYPMRIDEVTIANNQPWVRKNLNALTQSYGNAPYSAPLLKQLSELIERPWDTLVSLNEATTRWHFDLLSMRVDMIRASELPPTQEDPTQRLIELCRSVGGDAYLSGVNGREYLDMNAWRRSGLGLYFHEYHHPVYPQVHNGFESQMAAIDLLCNMGPGSFEIIRQGSRIRNK